MTAHPTIGTEKNAQVQEAESNNGPRALLEMKAIAQKGEPGLLHYLQTRSGLSAEYAMTSAITRSKNPNVKVGLVNAYIQDELDRKDFAGMNRIA